MNRRVVVGKEVRSPLEWAKARDQWEAMGLRTGLYRTPEQMAELERKAEPFYKATGLKKEEVPRDIPPEQLSPELRDSYEAHAFLAGQAQYQQMTNFPHHYHRAAVLGVDAEPRPADARRLLWQADQYRQRADEFRALRTYKEGLDLWKKVLLSNRPSVPEFRQDSNNQEEVYEHQLRYLRLYQDYWQPQIKAHLLLPASLRLAFPALTDSPDAAVLTALIGSRRRVPLDLKGPLDENAPDGRPLIGQDARETVNSRLNVGRPAPPPSATDLAQPPKQ